MMVVEEILVTLAAEVLMVAADSVVIADLLVIGVVKVM
jgi:hypothetical protein